MKPETFLAAQAFALKLVESAVEADVDYNVAFNGFGMAVVGFLIPYMEDVGIELNAENMATQLQKFFDNTYAAGQFYVEQHLALKEQSDVNPESVRNEEA